MARCAFELFVFGYLMRECFERSVRRTDRNSLRGFGRGDRHRDLILLTNAANCERADRAEDDKGFEKSCSW